MPDKKKSLSEAQLAANRANAQKSSGPVSIEGKARSSANSFKHGFCSRTVHVATHERDRYDQFVADLLSDLRPASNLEHTLGVTIADAYWRLSHIRSVEEVMFTLPPELPSAQRAAPRSSQRSAQYDPFAHLPHNSFDPVPIDPDTIAVDSTEPPAPRPPESILDAARVFLHRSQSFTNLTLYEQRIHRTIKTSMDELRRLQAERAALLARELPQAVDRAKERKMRGLPFDPVADGFVCSSEEIAAAIRRHRRENAVGIARECEFKLEKFQKYLLPKVA